MANGTVVGGVSEGAGRFTARQHQQEDNTSAAHAAVGEWWRSISHRAPPAADAAGEPGAARDGSHTGGEP